MILIVGASGYLGRTTAELLLARGHRVRLMVRNPAKVDDFKQQGAEVVHGDLIDAASLALACRGVDQVIAVANSMAGRGKYRSEAVDDAGHRALIDAAKTAGVSHFVYTSVLGAAQGHAIDFWRIKFRIEEYLKASGLGYTILRPAGFMEWHAHDFNGKSILSSGKTMLLGTPSKPRNLIAVRDVAQFVVLALSNARLNNRTLELGGPDTLTNNQIAKLYGKLAGLEPKISHLPSAVLRVMGLMLKPFHPGISRIMRISSLPESQFSERFDPAALLAEFPMQLTTLEEFILERIAEVHPKSRRTVLE